MLISLTSPGLTELEKYSPSCVMVSDHLFLRVQNPPTGTDPNPINVRTNFCIKNSSIKTRCSVQYFGFIGSKDFIFLVCIESYRDERYQIQSTNSSRSLIKSYAFSDFIKHQITSPNLKSLSYTVYRNTISGCISLGHFYKIFLSK